MFIPALDQSTPHVHSSAAATDTYLGNIHLAWMVSQHITNTRLGNIHLAWMVKQHIFPATWTESGRSSCSGSDPYTLTYGSDVSGNVAVGAVLSVTDEATHFATYTYTVTAISSDGTEVTMDYTSDDSEMGADSPCNMVDFSYSPVMGTYTNP